MLAAIVAIGAYTLDVHRLEAILAIVKNYFPIDVAALLGSHLRNAFQYNLRNIGVAIVAIIVALYGATRAMYILVSAMNTVYEQKETRSTLKLMGLCFVMSLGAILVIAISLGLVLIDQTTLEGMPQFFIDTLPVVRWVLLALIIAVSLAIFYRLAPSNHDPHWRWVSWGAGIASLTWLAGTTLFFLYAKYISIYDTLYNVFGSVFILLIWLNLSAFVILLGAQINHRLEARTTLRTTR